VSASSRDSAWATFSRSLASMPMSIAGAEAADETSDFFLAMRILLVGIRLMRGC